MQWPSVVLRLQQAGHDCNLPVGNRGGFGLQADKAWYSSGDGVGMVLPPAPAVRFPGQGEQLAALGVAHSIEVEQLLDFVDGRGLRPSSNRLIFDADQSSLAATSLLVRLPCSLRSSAASRRRCTGLPIDGGYRYLTTSAGAGSNDKFAI
jgi:hypothetical protein